MTSTTPDPPPLHLAILGAGISGLSLAIALTKSCRQNLTFALYEAAPSFSPAGAGIGLGPNALAAMDLIDPGLRAAYKEAATGNERESMRHAVFEAVEAGEGRGGWERKGGLEDGEWDGRVGAAYFQRTSAHRRDLLRILMAQLGDRVVKFGARVVEVRQPVSGQGRLRLLFNDGGEASADAVIGCDGIKGASRSMVLGSRWPGEVSAKYCGTYIYRGIVPMEAAKEVLGAHAGDAKWFMAKDRGVAMYPISKGLEANFVFFVRERAEGGWSAEQEAIVCEKEEMVKDLEGFDPRLLRLLEWAQPLKWPVCHHPNTPAYFNGRICLVGDGAHASSPGQAAGAGQGLEDAVVLARLLSLVREPEQLEAAFRAYDEVRRPRAQKVVRTSLEAGEMYAWNHPEIGSDMRRIVENANQRLHWIWQHDLKADVERAEGRWRELVVSASERD